MSSNSLVLQGHLLSQIGSQASCSCCHRVSAELARHRGGAFRPRRRRSRTITPPRKSRRPSMSSREVARSWEPQAPPQATRTGCASKELSSPATCAAVSPSSRRKSNGGCSARAPSPGHRFPPKDLSKAAEPSSPRKHKNGPADGSRQPPHLQAGPPQPLQHGGGSPDEKPGEPLKKTKESRALLRH